MIRLLKRFFEDIHRIANILSAHLPVEIPVALSETDRDLLTKFRRCAPRVKSGDAA